ncbi:MAG: tRNA (guanosine(37)-N1)-methyltransferase TrmD [Chloroflexaceae bacterium]|jgi:tRNA (guanine37-N1)-methyltransferase|nr:tRNA (guanosine(37)-N1)-methyltransferase TrmD [Chloroflexaceae bacterium]
MRFDILTLFPAMFSGPLTESILKRAQQAGLISVHLHDIRAYATDKHRTCDDTPYGGGAGMVMKAVPLAAAIRGVLAQTGDEPELIREGREAREGEGTRAGTHVGANDTVPTANPSPSLRAGCQLPTANGSPPVILLSPDGEPFSQRIAEGLAREPRLLLVCGHYEGVDERVRETLITREISIGDYVLTGGELAAMVLVDAVARLVPGVLDAESIAEESHGDHLLEYPHYTRPALWEGREVPPVLLSGHHGEVATWRRQQRLRRTLERRPDMLQRAVAAGALTKKDLAYLASLGWENDEV